MCTVSARDRSTAQPRSRHLRLCIVCTPDYRPYCHHQHTSLGIKCRRGGVSLPRMTHWRAHQPPLASCPGAHPVQDRRNDLPAISAETPVDFHQLTCSTTVQSLYRRQTGFSGFWRHPNYLFVFHHTWRLHRRWRYSDSVLRHFSFICQLVIWFAILLCPIVDLAITFVI